MKILSISDIIIKPIYSPVILDCFRDINFVISCGDLPFSYLEYIQSMLNKNLYYVNGNHAPAVRHGYTQTIAAPSGGINLHRRVIQDPSGLLLAGIEGCVLYNHGPYQYSQADLWGMVFKLVPRFLLNKRFYKRYLDIFVTHAAPWKIHDEEDLTHQGIKAFRWLVKVFRPALHLHGHIHVYNPLTTTETLFHQTWVINTFGYRVIRLEPDLMIGGKTLLIQNILDKTPYLQEEGPIY